MCEFCGLKILDYRLAFRNVFHKEMDNMDKELRDSTLKILYENYEEDLFTIQRCIKFLKDVEKERTKEYEQKYLEVAGVK